MDTRNRTERRNVYPDSPRTAPSSTSQRAVNDEGSIVRDQTKRRASEVPKEGKKSDLTLVLAVLHPPITARFLGREPTG
jgi:hypothetical protein